MSGASAVRNGYGWGVGAVGFAFLSGFFAWISDFASSREAGRSTDFLWQVPLILGLGAGVVALLLAYAAWRRGGGRTMGMVAAAGAVGSMVAAPILVAAARPRPVFIQVESVDPVRGTAGWTSHPHLVEANSIRPVSGGLVEIDGFEAQGRCNSVPATAVLDGHTGAVRSLTASAPGPSAPLVGPALAGEPGAPSVSVLDQPPIGPGQSFLVAATDAGSGTSLWERVVTAAPGSAPVGVEWSGRQTVVLSNGIDMKFAALKAGAGAAFVAPPVSVPPDAAQGVGTPTSRTGSIATTALPMVIALSAVDGHELWRAQVSGTDRAAGIAAGSNGVVTSDGPTLTWRDLRTGAALATRTIPSSVPSQLAVSGSSVAVLDTAGVLTGFDATLVRRWQLTVPTRPENGPDQVASASGDFLILQPGKVAGSNCGGE